MKIKEIEFKVKALICLMLYYGFAQYLPVSFKWRGGGKIVRYQLVKRIFKHCGKNVNVERKAHFGSGRDLEIGDNSGLGINCVVPSNTKIGNNVMMAPNCYILANNHDFSRTDIPMIQQGSVSATNIQTVIEDDVWIGMNVTMTPGRHVRKGSIIGACTLLCKDFPEYSVIGGNPSKLLRSRMHNV